MPEEVEVSGSPPQWLLLAYQRGAIGNGVNGEKMNTADPAVQPVSSPVSVNRKPLKRALVKDTCTYAKETGCTRNFAERPCVKAVLAGMCKPPGSVRLKFVDGRHATDDQLLIASGGTTRK